jgi:hypothetical protein
MRLDMNQIEAVRVSRGAVRWEIRTRWIADGRMEDFICWFDTEGREVASAPVKGYRTKGKGKGQGKDE